MFCFTGNMLGNPALNWDLTSFCQGNMPGGPESIELARWFHGDGVTYVIFFSRLGGSIANQSCLHTGQIDDLAGD